MKERGIIMQPESVRGILREVGPKTHTRRVVKPQPPMPKVGYCGKQWDTWEDGRWGLWLEAWPVIGQWGLCGDLVRCPYGKPGDLLYVKETFFVDDLRYLDGPLPKERPQFGGDVYYRADGECCDQIPECACGEIGKPRWRSSMFMPRWASRINLEVTEVRVERVQEITKEDAISEGLAKVSKDGGRTWKYGVADRDGLPGNDDFGWHWHEWEVDPRDAFRRHWDVINGKRPGCSWNANPWVWVIGFKLLEVRRAAA